MASITKNIRLPITNRETNKTFLDWRLGVDGPGNSAFQKLDDAWGKLMDKVNAVKNLVGTPAAAKTTADMTDKSKVYVYTGDEAGYTNGNWYYHDGEAWVSGGVYQATAIPLDETLTEAGAAADAAAVGRGLQNRVAAVEIVNNKLHVYMGDDVEPDEYKIATDTYEGLHMEYDEETNLLHLYDKNNTEIGDPVKIIGGGGGSGGGNNAVITVQNVSGWQSRTLPSGASCPISITWSSLEDENPTGNGTVKVVNGGVTKAVRNVSQGTFTIDIGAYLNSGDNAVRVTVTDVYGNYKTIIFNVKYATFSLNSTFDASTAKAGKFSVAYTPSGGKQVVTLHHLVDGHELSTGTEEIRADGKGHTFEVPAQAHGAHTLEFWFDSEIDGEVTESNRIYCEFISVEAGNNTPIISTPFRETMAAQYATINIPYTVYSGTYTSDIVIRANGAVVSELTVDRSEQIFTYRSDDQGSLSIVISCGSVSRTINLTVEESDIHVDPATDQMALYLTSTGRSNSEKPTPAVWKYNDIEAVFTNFNFKSDGWITEDGSTALRVGGGTRVTIPYKPFAEDLKATGKTIEVEFSTHDVLNYDSPIISCLDGTRGFYMTSQLAKLTSEQSAISMQYKEDEHVRISFVAEKSSENRLLYIYVNGIMSGVVQYPSTDNFIQANPAGITIGSDDCTVDVYCIRIYDTNLSREQILNNWIADTQDIDEMLVRYRRNNVYDEYGNITIPMLPAGLPYMIVECPELPQYKGDKKTVNVTYVDPASNVRSFTADGAEADVQGTSSQYYPRKNYKIKFKKSGFDLGNGEHVSKYALRDGGVPTNAFCFKADVASSEGANNVELARLYNDVCPYRTVPQQADERVRQGIDGFPIVIFWNDGTDTTFIGKYNFNNDKGTEEVFGFADGDESWEIKNNNSARVIFKSADFTSTKVDSDGKVYAAWLDDFEGRYPDGSEDASNLKQLSEWLVSTDRTVDGLTEEQKAERLEKFRAELPDHLEKDAVIFYYLFTELFLMVDSRAKNAFPSFIGGSKWFSLPYDFDTAIGINNEGALVFSYNLEDTDIINGEKVYNGQDSVLWNNLRDAFYNDIKTMYQTLRSSGKLSYSAVERMFEEHQIQWGEAIFNEDAYFKYLQPLLNDGTATYLPMLQGSKAEQRKWWLYNRFRYMDSKYNTGDNETDFMSFRAYDNADIAITPYADIYASVKFGNTSRVQKRAARNVPVTIENPLDTLNDTEIAIYSAGQIASLGDLSGLQLSTADFSRGVKLQSLKIGDADPGYDNAHLRELHVGNNYLLREIDVRNCSGLGQTHGDKETTKSVDLSGCTNIERVYFDGTNILGVVLPDGGVLKTLHLPASTTNLTILNQPSLTEFVIPSYGNLSTVRLENVGSGINTEALIGLIPTGTNLRMVGFRWEAASVSEITALYDRLDQMKGVDGNGYGVDKAQMIGTIHIASITGAEAAALYARYPDITIDADSSEAVLTYYNYDGSEVLYTETVLNRGDGTYTGTPERTGDAQYRYMFDGWSTAPNQTAGEANATKNVVGNRDVYAAYIRTVNEYTVSWLNDDGSTLKTETYAYGATPNYGTMPKKGGVTAIGWEPDVVPVTGDATYTARYGYRVRFYNGMALLKQVDNVAPGTVVEYIDEDHTENPSKNGYRFDGWTPAVAAVNSDVDYYAKFVRLYTVTFYNSDADRTSGTALKVVSDVDDGASIAEIIESEAPTATAPAHYVFNSWDPASGTVTGDTAITAKYDAVYTVEFYNDPDAVTPLYRVENLKVGQTAAYGGAAPSLDGKDFNGNWIPSNVVSAGNADANHVIKCYAQYNDKHTVRFINVDGSHVVETKYVSDGERAEYTGEAFEHPYNTRLQFLGWNPALTTVITADTDFYAVYEDSYTVRFYEDSAKTKLLGTVNYVEAGGTASIDNPTKTGYNFKGWTPANTGIRADTDCIAQWAQIFTVTFKNMDNTTLDTVTVESGSNAEYSGTPTHPYNAELAFTGWQPSNLNITANTTCVAQYETSYTVKFMNGSTTLQTLNYVKSGSTVAYTGTTPTNTDKTTFLGWATTSGATAADADLTNITANKTFYAAFNPTFTVTFRNQADSSTLGTSKVEKGHNASYSGSTPTNTDKTTFLGWAAAKNATAADSTILNNITANKTVYAAHKPAYTVSFYNGSTKLTDVKVETGGTAVYSGTTPTDPNGGDFLGWAASAGQHSADANILKNITANKSVYAAFTSAFEDVEITDDWATILNAIDKGTYATKYKLGNYKPLDLGTEGTINMQIVAMDEDDLADGSGKAPITMIAKELLTTKHNMNSSNTTSGGWAASAMRTYLNGTILDLIPAEVKAAIKPVTKYSSHYTNSAVQKDVTSTDSLWIPSNHEVGFGTTYETLGPVYSLAFKDNASRKKCVVGSTSARYWWLRSAYNSTYFRFVSSDGSDSNNSASTSSGVALGFCLGSRLISESWGDIIASVNDGSYATKYHVGDKKLLTLGAEGPVTMVIAAMDTDELADDSGNKAPITWISEELLKTTHRMNASNTTEGGWESTEMRTYLNETIKPMMPAELQAGIKTVKKYSRIFRSGSAVNDVESDEDLWIPSSREVNFAISNVETLGPQYSALFPDNASRIKYRVGSSSASPWWLRSAGSSTSFRYVYSDGSSNDIYASTSDGVALGFCT